MVVHEAIAGERPHQRLQDRSKHRNRKQRNKNQTNNNQNNDNNDNNGNQNGKLGGLFSLGCSVAFSNLNSEGLFIEVWGENGNLKIDCPPGFNATLSADSDAVEFVIYGGWATNLYIGAFNPDVGEPEVKIDRHPECKGCVDSSTTHSLTVGEGFTVDWPEGDPNRKSFYIERQSDSSDYKMFLVTALA